MPQSPRSLFKDDRALLIIGAAVLLAFEVLFLARGAVQGLWLIGPGGLTAKTDFAEFWGAGRLAATGHAAAAYRWADLRDVLERGAPGSFAHAGFPFFYPPMLLLLLAPLAAGSIWLFAAAWVGGTFAAFLGFARTLGRNPTLLALAIASPAGFLCIAVGQNGLLTAALLGGGLALLDRRPILAGALLGLIAYKPQFGVLLPFALAASGRWKSFAAAGASVVVTAGLSGLVFGASAWTALAGALTGGASGVPALATLPAIKLQSVYGLVLTLGAPTSVAWAVQAAVAFGAIAFVVQLWRSKQPLPRQAAGLAASILLVSPYSCVYDLTLTAVAILFLIADARPMASVQRLALGAAYILPLVFLLQPAPMGPVLCALIVGVIAMQMRQVEGRAPSPALAMRLQA